MILEIEDILRNIKDIRKAILSLETREMSGDQINLSSEITELANQMEHKTRILEYELNG